MRNPHRRLAAIARLAVATLVALAITTPASAQVGGLRKKMKPTAGQPADNAATAAPGDQGGTILITDDVVSQLLAGLKAGRAEREAAAKEDTPYARYKNAEAAYAEAQPKCEAAQQTFPERAVANQKMADKHSALTQKMVAAMEKHDQKLVAIYQDSVMALMDPSCVVKKPEPPKEYYQAQRDVDVRAEQQEAKASSFTPGELAMVKERTIAILQGATPPGDASPMEKSAVSAKSAELKPLLGIAEQPTARAAKTEPAPAPTPAPAAAPATDPQASAAASKMGDCMSKNVLSHQAEIEALGKRAQAAQKAQDQGKLMAIADTLQQIQMAGCMGR